jgi:hypothetical protein
MTIRLGNGWLVLRTAGSWSRQTPMTRDFDNVEPITSG